MLNKYVTYLRYILLFCYKVYQRFIVEYTSIYAVVFLIICKAKSIVRPLKIVS